MGTQGDQAVAIAKTWLGVPYLYTGTTRNGVDCSALVQNVFASMGIKIPRTTDTQAVVGKGIASLAVALPGDCCYFGPAGTVGSGTNGHTGIYVGGGQMIDAPHSGTVVRYDAVGGFTGQETLAAIRRFWDDTGVPIDPSSITNAGSTDSSSSSATLLAANSANDCALNIKLPGSGLPLIGSSLQFCLWYNGWSRAALGGLMILGAGFVVTISMVLLARAAKATNIGRQGVQAATITGNLTSMFRTGAR